MARTKKDIIAEENFIVNEEFQSEEFQIEENPKEEVIIKEEKKKEKKKEFGTVFLISKSGVYYNYNGEARYMTGKFNVKVGDRIEI